MRISQLLLIAATSIPTVCWPTPATTAAQVEGLQLPAWITRDSGLRQALKPGTELTAGDKITTGATGRISIRTEDGSLIKLGVDAEFNIDDLTAGDTSNDTVFQGFWKVLRGAFRFTTTALGANRKRNIAINVGTATIGIRGTDIWGKSNNKQDLVCLIEGNIEITRPNETPVNMSEPLSVYTAARNQPANPLSKISVPQLTEWAEETELLKGQGVLVKDGDYIVYLLSARQQAYAEAKRNQYQAAGYPAEITQHEIDDVNWYRVGITDFSSFQDAKAFSAQIQNVLPNQSTWIQRQQ